MKVFASTMSRKKLKDQNKLLCISFFYYLQSNLRMTVDALKKASLWQSLRRSATAEAENRHLSPVVIDKNKRWRKVEKSKEKGTSFLMCIWYADLCQQLEKELVFHVALWLRKDILLGLWRRVHVFMILKWKFECLSWLSCVCTWKEFELEGGDF